MINNEKTSLLVRRQVPEFVRDEHPKFVSFLEAYYEFLENKQGTQKNDLISKSKDLRYLSDVDYSLEEFEQNFFNTYASLMPIDVSVSKEILIKNVLPLYLAKGSEKSFKLLFRLLFDQDSTVRYPKDSILRASDGKWKIDNVIRIDKQVYQLIIGNGVSTIFRLSQETDPNTIQVFLDGVLQTSGYYIRKEAKQIVFDTAPSALSEIQIYYTAFDFTAVINRKVTGKQSGATAIVEKLNRRTIAGENYFELFIDTRTLLGNFENGEILDTDILDEFGNLLILELQTLSDVNTIAIIDGGASYNIGDSVVVRGEATRQATAIISDVATGNIEEINVLNGGAGFKLNSNVTANGFSTASFFGVIETVDSSGTVSPNTISFFTNLISDPSVDFANTTIASLNYGFSNVANANLNTSIAVALTANAQNIGPISTINVQLSSIISGSNPVFDIEPINVAGDVDLVDLGCIGRIQVNSGGSGYIVGEYITITNQWDDFSGLGANAQIGTVDANGAITRVKVNSGGLGYSSNKFPILTVNTANGSNANLAVYSLLGDGELLQGVLADFLPGEILSIKIIDPGAGYTTIPAIDLGDLGNGLARANAQISDSYQELQGKWTKSDGLLSTEEIRIQGAEYYVNYSYVMSSKVEFNRYREIFKRLIHPTGFISHNEFIIDIGIENFTPTTLSLPVLKFVTGTVNVNSSIYVTGTNTKFQLSNTNGVLIPGANVAINSEVRTVNTIISNTVFTVTQAFTITSNGESLVITT